MMINIKYHKKAIFFDLINIKKDYKIYNHPFNDYTCTRSLFYLQKKGLIECFPKITQYNLKTITHIDCRLTLLGEEFMEDYNYEDTNKFKNSDENIIELRYE